MWDAGGRLHRARLIDCGRAWRGRELSVSMVRWALLAGLLGCTAESAAADPLIAPKDMERVTQGARLLTGALESVRQDQGMSPLQRQRWAYGVFEQPQLAHALDSVLQRIRNAAGPAATPARIHLTPDPRFQAYAAEDGAIFIAAGMLQSLESEDELAALIAHEYVHVLREHTGRSALQNIQGAAAGISSLYMEQVHGRGAEDARDPDVAFMRQTLLREAAMQTVQAGIVPTRARSQEDQADREGVDLMIAAGFNPVGMVEFLGRLDVWNAQRNAVAADAPDAPKGVGATLTRFLQNSDQARSAGRKSEDRDLVGGLIASVVGGAQRGLGRAGRSHRDAAQRIDQILAHIDKRHPDAARPHMRPVPWAQDRQVVELFASLDGLHALLADDAALARRSDRAHVDTLMRIARSPAGTTPLGRYTTLRALVGSGKDAGAAALQQELGQSDSLFIAHQMVLELVSRSGDRQAAVRMLDISRQSLGDPPELLPYGVRLHRRAGNTDVAEMYASRCAGSGDAVLQRACREEL